MAIVIKKKVTFEFLGDEYKDAYINFQRIPIKDFEKIIDETETTDKAKSIGKIIEYLKKYFIDGSWPDIDKLTKDDLDGLDSESTITCFKTLTGQSLDPKEDASSTTPSTTDQELPSNS